MHEKKKRENGRTHQKWQTANIIRDNTGSITNMTNLFKALRWFHVDYLVIRHLFHWYRVPDSCKFPSPRKFNIIDNLVYRVFCVPVFLSPVKLFYGLGVWEVTHIHIEAVFRSLLPTILEMCLKRLSTVLLMNRAKAKNKNWKITQFMHIKVNSTFFFPPWGINSIIFIQINSLLWKIWLPSKVGENFFPLMKEPWEFFCSLPELLPWQKMLNSLLGKKKKAT